MLLHGRCGCPAAPFLAVSGDPDARGLTEGGEAVDAAQGEGRLDVLAVKAAVGQSGHGDRLVGMDGCDRPPAPGNQARQVGPVMGIAMGQARAPLSRRPLPPVARQTAITCSSIQSVTKPRAISAYTHAIW